MNNLIICGALLCCSYLSQAQSHALSVEWGQAFKSHRSMVTDIVSAENGDIYAVKERFGLFGSGVYIEKYQDMKPVRSAELDYNAKREEELVKEVIRLGNELWVLNLNTSYEHARLSAQQVNMDNLKIAANDEDIFDIEIERKLRYAYGGYLVRTNDAQDRLGVIVQYPGSRDEACELGFQMRDQYMDMIWTEKVELPYIKEMVELYAMEVANDGTIYALLQVFEPRGEGSSKRSKEFSYSLFRLGAQGGLQEVKINLNDRLLQQVDLHIEGNHMLLGGFYGINCCTAEGVFQARVDLRNMDLTYLNATSFTVDFIAQGYGDRVKRKLERKQEDDRPFGLDNIELKEFVPTEDGGALLIGELYDVAIDASDQKTVHDQSSSHFNYMDIVVTRLDARGAVLWTRKIMKRQETGDDAGLMSGYVMARMNGKYYFLFNDHRANRDVERIEDLQPFTRDRKDGVVALVTITENGDLSKENLFDQKDMKLEIRPHSCEQVSANELLLFGMSRDKNQFARITLQDEQLNVSLP